MEIEKRGNIVSSITSLIMIVTDGVVDMVTESVVLKASTDAEEGTGNEEHVGVILTSIDIEASTVEDELVFVEVEGVIHIGTDGVCDDDDDGKMENFFKTFPLGTDRFHIDEVWNGCTYL